MSILENELLGFWQAHTPKGGRGKLPPFHSGPRSEKNGNKHLHGQVSCEISARLYGADNWWVLLDSDC